MQRPQMLKTCLALALAGGLSASGVLLARLPQDEPATAAAATPSTGMDMMSGGMAGMMSGGMNMQGSGMGMGMGMHGSMQPGGMGMHGHATGMHQMPGMSGGMGTGMGGMAAGMQVRSERDYLRRMIPHHQEAITSATIVSRRSNRPQMRMFASRIVTGQRAEVKRMRYWLERWYPGTSPARVQPMMRTDLGRLQGDALDRAFLQGMIPHHMMAVHMSQSLLSQKLAQHAQVGMLAGSIRDTQQAEIRRMRTWLSTWYGQRGTMQMQR